MFHIALLAVEFCLAHKLRDRVEAAYLRTDLLVKRRHILEEWGSYATQQEKVLEEVRDLGFQRLDTNYKGC